MYTHHLLPPFINFVAKLGKSADCLKVILNFILAAFITVVASVVTFWLRPSSYEENFPPPDPIAYSSEVSPDWSEDSPCIASGLLVARKMASHRERNERWVKILEKLILNLSDQQVATSLAMLLTTFIRHCEISNYHLNVVCDIAWFSTITHSLSMVILRKHWRQESRRLVRYIRIGLVLGVLVLLGFALTLSPQYIPSPGNGGCPAYCEFIRPDANSIFNEVEFFVQPNISNFASVVQTILLVWGYSTTGEMMWTPWYFIHRFFTWTLPGYVFRCVRWITLAGITRIYGANHDVMTWKIFDWIRRSWKVIWFPSTRTAVIVQIFSWCFALCLLVLDRWVSEASVTDPSAENEWTFGQLLATITLFLPLLPFLEAWSGTYDSSIATLLLNREPWV